MGTIELGKTMGGINGGEVGTLAEIDAANAALGVKSPVPQTIDATDIGTPGVTMPKVEPSNIGAELASIEQQALSIKDMLDKQQAGPTAATGEMSPTAGSTQPTSLSDVIMQQMIGMNPANQETNPEIAALQQTAADANLLARNLQNDMTAYAKQTREAIMEMRKNPEGKWASALQAEISNFEYDRYNGKDGLADMAIAAQYALNNAQYANEIAQNAVDAEEAQYNRQMTYLSNLYNMAQNDMSESEKMQYQSQLNMYEYQTQSLIDSKQAAMQRATTNGAPPEVLTAIKNAETPEQVWMSAGQYGEDPQLDLQRQQIAISRGNLALQYEKFEWDKWHADRVLSIEQGVKAGQIAAEDAEKVKVATAMLKNNAKLLNATKEALNNKLGMNAATGRYKAGTLDYFTLGIGGAGAGTFAGPMGAGAGAISGLALAGKRISERENFENDIKLIASAQTLAEFSNLGFSLAPVTEKELDLVGSSAGEVLAAVRISEDGTMEIKGSTAEFEKNLRAFEIQTQKAFDALLEDPYLQQGLLGNDLADFENEYYQMTGQTPPQTNTVPQSNSTYYKITESMTNVPTR